MKIYTLFYKDTGLYNRAIFVLPNDETAKKAMKLNLMQSDAERFRNEVKDGSVELVSLAYFNEEEGIHIEAEEEDFNGSGGFVFVGHMEKICNLKDLLNDDTGNSESVQRNDS